MYQENISMNIDESISIICDEATGENDTNHIEAILKEINEGSCLSDYNFDTDTLLMVKTIDYDTNYNVKQLLTICDYYGLLKEIKTNKLKKEEIISFLLDFEENAENSLIVYKRKQLWYFMEELKNDKFMKKYILWQK